MDKHFMKMALRLAEKGRGNVSPNPLVGAVIVKNDTVLGMGYHMEYGKNHAEINAINNAKGISLRGATIYVNLEPCTIYGNTPPCVDRIIKEKFGRVVIAQTDPNPLINGSGVKKLKDAGIDVTVGVLKDEAIKLNSFYNHFIEKKRPFFTIKAAMTLDGKIADIKGDSNWITNEKSRKYAMRLRFINDAVLVGAQTVRKDNPRLNIRGFKKKRPFFKIILSKKLEIAKDAKIFDTEGRVLMFCGRDASRKNMKAFKELGADIFVYDKSEEVPLEFVAKQLYDLRIQSVLVEGGALTLSKFISQKYTDGISLFYAPKIFGGGIGVFSGIKPKDVRHPLSVDVEKLKKFDGDFYIEGTLCSRD